MIDRFFQVTARGSSVPTELRAGAVTFMTMCYIVFVQPAVLSNGAGMDLGAVLVATCLSAALATLIMGLWANYPIAQAPLMGENFFFAFAVVAGMKVPWQTALGIVFLSGVLFLALTLLHLRERLLDAIPETLKASIAAGIGIFVAFIGLTEGGLVAKASAPGAFVNVGDLGSPPALLTLFGLAVTSVLLARRTRGAILIGLALSTVAALATGLVHLAGVVSAPPSVAPTFLQMDLAAALQHPGLIVVFLFMLLFDTVGTLIGVSEQAGLTVDGRLPHADRAMLSDAVGTLAGAALGTSTVSSYIESASGVADGARTGLANVMTAGLFLAALFFAPLIAAVGGGVAAGDGVFLYPITAPVIILVGSFMLAMAARVRWEDPTESIPAFLTMTVIPFTFNIAHGVAAGIVSYVLVKTGAGRFREVSPFMAVTALVVVVGYATLPAMTH